MNDEKPAINRREGFFQKNPVLRINEFLYFLCVRFTVIFALNIQSTLIYYWVFDLTNSKLNLAYIGLAEVIPAIGCSLFSGYLVDIFEKRKMVMLCILGYWITGSLLFFLTTGKALSMFHLHNILPYIYSLIFLGGVIRSFLGPSTFALLGLIVPKELYPNASSWSSMSWQVGAVLGPLTAGGIIAWKGVETGMSFVVLILLLSLIPALIIKKKPIFKKKEKEPMLRNLSLGLRFVFKTPVLLASQCLDMFSVLFGGAVALLPVYQKEILHVSEVGFGILRAAPGLGALCSLALLAFFPIRRNPGKKLFACVFGFGTAIIIFGISKNFYLSFFMLVCTGMFDAISVVIRDIIMQLFTPDHMRGRVSAVRTMFVSSSNELGDFESGMMAQWLGTVRAVVVGGSITLMVVLITMAKAPQLRNFNFYKKEADD